MKLFSNYRCLLFSK